MTNHLKGLLMTIFAVVILSPDSVLIRLVEEASSEIDSWTVLFWRGSLYAVGVSLLVLIKYRSKTIAEFKNIGKGGLLIGLFSGISTGTFVFAIVYTSIANALVIISTGPIMIAIVAWFLLKEKSSLITWASMVIVFIGIYIVMSGSFGGKSLVGDFFALITAVMMGFTGSISNIPEAQLARLPFPCFVLLEGQPTMLHDISRGQVKAVLPEFGMVQLSLSDFMGDQGGARVLTLSPGRDTQKRKLGLSWFAPQIRRYRRSLLEVLLVSLVLQLLNLAQPLVFQQIFDKVIGQQNLDTLYTLGMLLLGVALFQGLLTAVRTYLFADTTNRIDIALAVDADGIHLGQEDLPVEDARKIRIISLILMNFIKCIIYRDLQNNESNSL